MFSLRRKLPRYIDSNSSAAAHNKLNNNEQALNDCFRSIEIDPNYSKAYGRLGYGRKIFVFEREDLPFSV